MKNSVYKKPRVVEKGCCFKADKSWVRFHEEPTQEYHFVAEITYLGKPAQLHFNGYGHNIPVNKHVKYFAPYLKFTIRGDVRLVTATSRQFKMRVWAHADEVRQAIAQLGLSDCTLLKQFGKRTIRTDVFTMCQEDMFAIKLCL